MDDNLASSAAGSLVRLNGHDVYLEKHGPPGGPAVVFLHHGLGSTHSWQNQAPDFAQAGFRLLVYDRWGYGKSERRLALDAPNFEADLLDLGSLLAMEGIRKTALVGHSDGGTIALLFACLHPERVSCLVSIAAHAYLEEKMGPGIDSLRRSFYGNSAFRSGLERVHGEKAEQVFKMWYAAWKRPEIAGWSILGKLTAVRCPALVVQGELDEHATAQHARAIAAAIAGAQCWLQPGVDHMFPQKQPQIFNPAAIDFLKKHAC